MTYRAGNHQPRNLYRGNEHIGVAFNPIDAAAIVRHLNMGLGECTCESYEPCRGECCGVGMCSCSATDEEIAQAEQGLSNHTPNVDYLRGAAEALAEVRRRLEHAAGPDEELAVGTVRHTLRAAAAELGLDEDAPSAHSRSTQSAETGSVVGRDTPDAHSGSEAALTDERCWHGEWCFGGGPECGRAVERTREDTP